MKPKNFLPLHESLPGTSLHGRLIWPGGINPQGHCSPSFPAILQCCFSFLQIDNWPESSVKVYRPKEPPLAKFKTISGFQDYSTVYVRARTLTREIYDLGV